MEYTCVTQTPTTATVRCEPVPGIPPIRSGPCSGILGAIGGEALGWITCGRRCLSWPLYRCW